MDKTPTLGAFRRFLLVLCPSYGSFWAILKRILPEKFSQWTIRLIVHLLSHSTSNLWSSIVTGSINTFYQFNEAEKHLKKRKLWKSELANNYCSTRVERSFIVTKKQKKRKRSNLMIARLLSIFTLILTENNDKTLTRLEEDKTSNISDY